MVLPLLAGVLTLLGTGYLAVGAAGFIAHWVAVVGGLAVGIRAFMYGMSEDPLTVLDTELLRTIGYGLISALVGFIGFKIVTAALTAFTLVIGLTVGLVLVLGSVFSFPFVFSGILSVLEFAVEMLGGD